MIRALYRIGPVLPIGDLQQNYPEPMPADPITILFPCNDNWEALEVAFEQLDPQLVALSRNVQVLVVDNASERVLPNNWPLKGPRKQGFLSIRAIDVVRLRDRYSNSRAIALGLKYVHQYRDTRTIMVMDTGDSGRPANLADQLRRFDKNDCDIMISDKANALDRLALNMVELLYKLPAEKPGNSTSKRSTQTDGYSKAFWKTNLARRLVNSFCTLLEFSDQATAEFLANRQSLPKFVRLRDSAPFIASEASAYRRKAGPKVPPRPIASKARAAAAGVAATVSAMPESKPTDPEQLSNLLAATGMSSGNPEPARVRDWILNPPAIPDSKASTYFRSERATFTRTGMANRNSARRPDLEIFEVDPDLLREED